MLSAGEREVSFKLGNECCFHQNVQIGLRFRRCVRLAHESEASFELGNKCHFHQFVQIGLRFRRCVRLAHESEASFELGELVELRGIEPRTPCVQGRCSPS